MPENESAGSSDEMQFEQAIAPLGVKVGSTRTVVATGESNDPSVYQDLTCLATYEDALTNEEQAVFGEDAAMEFPERVRYMLRSGLPEDDEGAELTATYLRAFAEQHDLPDESAVVLAIPTIDNPDGLDRLETAIEASPLGGEGIRSYPEALCGAIPAFGDGLEAIEKTFIAINLGSTNLEASAFRRGDQLATYATGAVTGSEVDRHIATKIEEETQGRVNIDLQTAREYKEAHADFEDYEPVTEVIQQPGGGTYEYTIETSVPEAIDDYLDEVVEEVANVFLSDLANDHVRIYRRALDEEIVLTGGMACIPGIVDAFAERLSEELNREVAATAPPRPDTAAAKGAHRIAERFVDMDAFE
ncbi:acetate and sugar kinases/Hsc70/actin family protein [Halanaeroarchaeum sulfurireducens]|uniref:Uncharacterized protein n=1 Tax=Halanaeroarchaeum sulfurireducens TaxID=1604004 RepID=A0A0F7PE04_9EURY|nr:rod shape-determining protein [Halanaeroarchaeum sulfurireducens]AKH98440.1 hypothetical protein HLASF_1972 [Halanaeroarchaeum sulfurireducens]ALG82834.1 hypothetical protein HLASA_1958 [Halanaeroarchaeum sulfurireducens]